MVYAWRSSTDRTPLAQTRVEDPLSAASQNPTLNILSRRWGYYDDDRSKKGSSRARAETALGEKLYSSRLAALNARFSAWVEAQLLKEPDVAIAEAARDYVSYADALDAKFLTQHTDVLSFGSGDCGQLAHGMDDDRDTIVPRPRRREAGVTRRQNLELSGFGTFGF